MAWLLVWLGTMAGHGAEREKPWRHPYYEEPLFLAPLYGRCFLEGFDPRAINTVRQTNGAEIARQFKPQHRVIPYNAEQILQAKAFEMPRDFVGTANMNADLGVQYTLREILRQEVLVTRTPAGGEKPAFVLVSHGHCMAALIELARMTTVDPRGQTSYLFDVSVYLPMGGWTPECDKVTLAADGGQIWGDELDRIRADQRRRKLPWAGGMAVALNGHRGDRDGEGPDRTNRVANVDPASMLGKPAKFAKFLSKRGLRRVVVVTEHLVKDPDRANVLPLDALVTRGDRSFIAANRDLYDYLKALTALGVEVVVASGEQRTRADGV